MAQKGQDFSQVNNPQNKTKKMSIAKFNSVQWLERYSACDTHAKQKVENVYFRHVDGV